MGRDRTRRARTWRHRRSFFSVCYLVEHHNEGSGFCKVLNYHWLLTALQPGIDPLSAISGATSLYEFERDLARSCVGLSKSLALADDSFVLPNYQFGMVSYIIFERGDKDIRRFLNTQADIDVAVKLRAVHNIATGLRQLHSHGIAHQDVKPSNAFVFPPSLTGVRETKIGDLGRATDRQRPADHDDYPIAGDPSYAPIEALYGAVPLDFAPRRYGCDVYQLGSMVSFVFTAAHINALLVTELHPGFHWQNWHGTYAEVLPYVRDAFGRVLTRIEESMPESVRGRLIDLVADLCDPDPTLRGHRVERRRRGDPFRLDRVVTDLDLLSRRSSVGFNFK